MVSRQVPDAVYEPGRFITNTANLLKAALRADLWVHTHTLNLDAEHLLQSKYSEENAALKCDDLLVSSNVLSHQPVANIFLGWDSTLRPERCSCSRARVKLLPVVNVPTEAKSQFLRRFLHLLIESHVSVDGQIAELASLPSCRVT